MSGIVSARSVVFQIDEKETAVAGRLRNIKNSENVLSRKLFASRQLNGSLHDSIGAPNFLASSRAPAQAGIEIIDVNSTNNVLIGNPFGLPESYVAIRVPYTGELAHRR